MKPFFFAIICFTLSALTCFAGETVTIAVDQENPPFMFMNSDKTAGGLYPALVSAVFSQMKTHVDIKPLPWKRALMFADNGETGVAGIYKNKERLAKYDYSDEIFQEKINIYVQKGHEFSYQKINDLNGKKIGVIRGWSYGDDFDNARKAGTFSADEGAGDDQNFTKLLHGRNDCVLAIAETGSMFLNKKEYKGKIVPLNNPITVNPTYIVFSKKTNSTSLLNHFNSTLTKMKRNGEYTKMITKYFSGE